MAVAACGFRPVHGTQFSAEQSPLQIEEIAGRAGHELRESLIQETRNGVPGAPEAGGLLVVDLDERILNTGFRTDGSAFRATIRLRARYVADFGEQAISGTVSSETNYDIPDAPFADIAAQNDAMQRAAGDLARKISNDMIFQLARSE
ncbi:MAG: LPS assembly lipoprotein LptE [Hyphomonadaceae bacterium]|nr:LPS assembly lipoprotein LptE [Hyphomonadaceae bacterium]